jgi:hypothetical protein
VWSPTSPWIAPGSRPGRSRTLVLDSFSPHKHPGVRAWATANDVEPVFPPTCGPSLNRIDSEFAADSQIHTGTDYPTKAA